MPSELINIFRDYLYNDNSDNSIHFLKRIYADITNNQGDESTLKKEIVVENKNGRKIKYSSENNKIQILEEGKDENEGESKENSKGVFIKFNILLLLLSLLFLGC